MYLRLSLITVIIGFWMCCLLKMNLLAASNRNHPRQPPSPSPGVRRGVNGEEIKHFLSLKTKIY
jgi:hypothetical protein